MVTGLKWSPQPREESDRRPMIKRPSSSAAPSIAVVPSNSNGHWNELSASYRDNAAAPDDQSSVRGHHRERNTVSVLAVTVRGGEERGRVEGQVCARLVVLDPIEIPPFVERPV